MREFETACFMLGSLQKRASDARAAHLLRDGHERDESLIALRHFIWDVGEQDQEAGSVAVDGGDKIDRSGPLATEHEEPAERKRRRVGVDVSDA